MAQIYDTNGDFVQTFAGSGEVGVLNGIGQATKFSGPSQIVGDTSSNLYVWDSGNNLIREITPSGTVSTLAGGGADFEGYGTNVSFSAYLVGAMAIDHSNTICLVVQLGYDGYGYGNPPYLLRIGTNGYVTFENGGFGLTNLSTSSGICFDSGNNLYYSGGNYIYRYNPTTGVPLPFAGNGSSGYVDGNGTVFPEFNSPEALVCDEANNIYVWDYGNLRIRRVDQNQNVTTIAGGGASGYYYGNIDGNGTNAGFTSPISAMTSDNLGDIYFACGNCIRKMNAQANVMTVAGNFGQQGFTDDVAGNLATFNGASGICISGGAVFVADSNNLRIRQISFNPQPQLVSGTSLGIGTFAGVTIAGLVGRTYQIQASPDLNNWTTQATVLLTSSPYFWVDQNNPVAGSKYYRAYLLP
jgi:hypothetical protein